MQSKYLADVLCVPGATRGVGDRGQCEDADLDGCCLTTEALRMVCHPHTPHVIVAGLK